MKRAIVVLGLAFVTAAQGQLLTLDGGGQTHDTRAAGEFRYTLRRPRPNEITVGRTTFSGVLVQLIKVRKPLELINPAAPPEDGPADENLARNLITQRPMGLKLFNLSF